MASRRNNQPTYTPEQCANRQEIRDQLEHLQSVYDEHQDTIKKATIQAKEVWKKMKERVN